VLRSAGVAPTVFFALQLLGSLAASLARLDSVVGTLPAARTTPLTTPRRPWALPEVSPQLAFHGRSWTETASL
jgi:hypothetical protein